MIEALWSFAAKRFSISLSANGGERESRSEIDYVATGNRANLKVGFDVSLEARGS